MSDAVRLPLMLGPVAVYFYILGIWQSGRRPRVISGTVDYTLLFLGMSGIILWGPAGQVISHFLFGEPRGAMIPLLWAAFVALWAVFLGGKAARRVVVYHADEATFLPMVQRAVSTLGGSYTKTLSGYEDVQAGKSLVVQAYPLLTVGSIEASGKDAEAVATALRMVLKLQAAEVVVPGPTRVTWGLFLFSWVCMIVPMVSLVLHEPRMQSIVHQFFQKLQGGF